MSAQHSPSEALRYAVLVPVKRPSVAKSRLAGLGDGPRRELAAAFAADTVSAVLSCERVDRALVVTDDHVVADGMSRLGAEVIPDGADDLNGTLLQAAAEMHRRAPGLPLATVCADLPALRPEELAAALDAADPGRMSFVADRERVGTTIVIAPGPETFRPIFGPDSRRRHVDAGAFEVDAVDVPTLRRDIDDPDDLADAMDLGVGPRTSMVCSVLGLGEDLGGRRAGTYARAVQATVSAFDTSTGGGRLLSDDGAELAFAAPAVAAGGLRLLRPGQRVSIETDGGIPPRVLRLHIAGVA
jgi:2-phospho-L-lactate/phosphoenolpyruvate guanylyltransferase